MAPTWAFPGLFTSIAKQKISKVFSSVFRFFKGLRLRRMGFFAVSIRGKSGLRVLSVSLWVFFGAVKLMKF